MDLKFIVNDYVLIWNLLFKPSINEELNTLKHRLWSMYKDDYNNTFNDKDVIFSDYRNYIPDNDNIYNIVMEKDSYYLLRNETEKYKRDILKTWDLYKRDINNILLNILKINIIPYNIFIVHKDLNLLDATICNSNNRGNIIIGKADNNLNIILNIILFILRKELKSKNNDIKKAIIELLVLNEIPTVLNKKSNYITGNPNLINLKRKIYPYWLMYLGVKEIELANYMQRDKIAFSLEEYKYDKYLSKMSILEFINYLENILDEAI